MLVTVVFLKNLLATEPVSIDLYAKVINGLTVFFIF